MGGQSADGLKPVGVSRRGWIAVLRRFLGRSIRYIYHRAPVPVAVKLRIKHELFTRAAFLFRGTLAYREWAEEFWPVTVRPSRMPAQPPRDAPRYDPSMWASEFGRHRPYTFKKPDELAQSIAAYHADRARRTEPSRIAVYTAIAGGYDAQKVHEFLDPAFDYHMFVDEPSPRLALYTYHPIEYFWADRARSARFVKLHPHLLLPSYDIAIWVDASFIIRGDLKPMVDSFLASGRPLGAFPHQIRRSVFEEAEACIRRKKDSEPAILEQMRRYDEEGFDCTDLIESGVFFADLRHPGIRRLFEIWWREIERGSRRDQLSVNYALRHAGLEYFPLTAVPDGIRNRPALALLAHDGDDGPAAQLARQLSAEHYDPWSGPSYATVRDARIREHRKASVDIVICVHNALEDVRACLASVDAHKAPHHRLLLVDDGSSRETRAFLESHADGRGDVVLLRNESPGGYTRAANQGLRASSADFVILLNSDTIVTDGWAEKMLDALRTMPGAGIVGPVSNAAGHQSIPDHRGDGEQSAINALPPTLTPEDMNRFCESRTPAGLLPRVPMVHGFCFGISRQALDAVGLFDEKLFPNGYGEEDDYCMRAADAGVGMVIATHTYVFHGKSKSYGDARRAISEVSRRTLRRLHGAMRVSRATRSVDGNPHLERLRACARALYG